MAIQPRFSNREAILAYKTEGATPVPDIADATYGTLPSTPAYATFLDAPTITKRGGIVRGRGVGTQLSTHRRRDRREAEITGTTRLSDASFAMLSACLQNSTGQLTRQAIWTGVSNRNTNGQQEAFRHCKAAQVQINLSEGSEVIVTPTFWSLGFPEVLASGLLSPSYANLVGAGPDSPVSWVNVTSIPMAGVELRDAITGVQITYNNNLERRNTRTDQGEDVPISRAAVDLIEGPVEVSGTLNLDARISPALLEAAAAAENWTDVGDIAILVGPYTLTIVDFNLDVEATQGGQSNGALLHTIQFVAKDVTFAVTTP